MSQEIEEYYAKKNQEFLDYWKAIDEKGRDGNVGVVQEDSAWLLLSGRDVKSVKEQNSSPSTTKAVVTP